MMGQLSSGQERLFYSFNIEDHIPANHLLSNIDRCLDLSDLRHYLADFYSPIGRPSIDPELMIRLLIVGYCYGIRSDVFVLQRFVVPALDPDQAAHVAIAQRQVGDELGDGRDAVALVVVELPESTEPPVPPDLPNKAPLAPL